MYNVKAFDVQTNHEKDHICKRIWNQKDAVYVILCFSNDCIVQTKYGLQRAKSGDCFIKSPSFIEYHFTPEDQEKGFINDWIYIQSSTMGQILCKYHLPVNEIISTNQPELIRGTICKIANEKRTLFPFSNQMIDNLIENMLIKISRASIATSKRLFNKYEKELLFLRENIQSDIQKPWNIQIMSEMVGLSNSRLSVIYKERFGKSPHEDLIEMRINKAKVLLLSSDKTLLDIAHECGFRNEFYFSRIFKKKENIAPGLFRRC